MVKIKRILILRLMGSMKQKDKKSENGLLGEERRKLKLRRKNQGMAVDVTEAILGVKARKSSTRLSKIDQIVDQGHLREKPEAEVIAVSRALAVLRFVAALCHDIGLDLDREARGIETAEGE